MSDLIDRQALLEKKIRIPIARVVTEDKIIYRDVVFVTDIEALPSEEPERKKGHWIYYDEFDGAVTHTCSECGKRMTTAIGVKANFCWNCGLDMRGEQDE